MKNALVSGAALGFVTVALACHPPFDECFEGCVDEKVRRVCFGTFGDQSFAGERQACPDGTRCVENYRSSGQLYSACAIGDLDPNCERDEDVTYCDGNTWVACRGHYRTRVEECGARFCVEHGNDAKCVPSAEPDPRCEGNDDGKKGFRFCDGNALVSCIGPWARVPVECGERFCRGVAGEAECRLRPAPDPRCANRPPRDFRYCDGDVAVYCDGDWREFEEDCAKLGRRCEEVLEIGAGKIPYAHCAE